MKIHKLNFHFLILSENRGPNVAIIPNSERSNIHSMLIRKVEYELVCFFHTIHCSVIVLEMYQEIIKDKLH
jgi:hypothetical protein